MIEQIAVGSFIAYNAAALVLKSTYTNVENVEEVRKTILDEGLYHITKEEYANKIMEDRAIKPSSGILSLGSKKVFFFAGIPNLESLKENVAGQYRQYEWIAIKINPEESDLKNYKVRAHDDYSVAYNGKCELDGKKVKKVNLVLDMDKEGELFIREKTQEEIEKGPYAPRQEIKDKYKMPSNSLQVYKDMGASYFKMLKRLTTVIKKGIEKLNPFDNNAKLNINENQQVSAKESNHQKQLEFLEELKQTSSQDTQNKAYTMKIQRNMEVSKTHKDNNDEIDM